MSYFRTTARGKRIRRFVSSFDSGNSNMQDPVTSAFNTRVLADSGTVGDLSYVDYMVKSAKNAGWWSSVVHWSSAGMAYKLASGVVSTLYSITGAADATQATTGNKPAWSGSGVFGTLSLPVVTYDGVDDYLSIGSGPTANPTVLTVIAVVNSTLNPVNSGVIYGHRSEATRLIQLTVQGSVDARLQLRGSGNALQTISNGSGVTSAHEVLVATFNKAGNLHTLSRQGGSRSTSSYNFTTETFNSTLRLIGAATTGSLSNPHKGNIAELIVVEAILSTGQISGIVERLRAHYNLF